MLIDHLGLAMSGVDGLIRVRPSRWRARRMHTRLRSEPGLAMRHGWHAGQAFACISGSAADLLVQGAHAPLLTLKNGQAYSLQQVNCLFV
jgi:hypothetical protein